MTQPDTFYHAFEARFRGSREEILQRLEAYAPLLESLASRFPRGRALDLGCGRGEWLEQLDRYGFAASGVDLDAGMLADCRERGFDVEQGAAIERLSATPDGSHVLISGFHIAEHLPFDELRQLVMECFRALAPGGVLLLETPNPENIRVATRDFYLDPTHRNPLPPALLTFLFEHTGFQSTVVLRLNDDPAVQEKSWWSLDDVLASVSPDYAVLGVREADARSAQALQQLADSHSGLDPDFAIRRYHETEEERFRALDRHLQRLLSRQESLDDQHEGIEERYQALLKKHRALQHQYERADERFQEYGLHFERLLSRQELLERHLAEIEEQREHQEQERIRLEGELHALYQSRSWRVTRPMRALGAVLRRLRGRGRRFLAAGLRRSISAIERHPALRRRLIGLAHRLHLETRLRHLYQRVRRSRARAPSIQWAQGSLTPRAERLYRRLSVQQGKKEP